MKKVLPFSFDSAEKSIPVPVGTPSASKPGMNELNITNSGVRLWQIYRALPDAEKEVIARGIVARLFGCFEAVPTEPGAELFLSIVEGELNTAQSREGGVL